MIKKTLYYGNDAYLHTKNNQLVVEFADKLKTPAFIPVEDIGVVILDAHRLTISQRLISKLLENDAALITCNEKHIPVGLMLNLDGNTLQQEKFHKQIEASKPLKKKLWQQTVKDKIYNQSGLLSYAINLENKEIEKMNYWMRSVRSGDPDNYEGRAAAFYWSKIFESYFADFTRGRFDNPPNNLLNYAYAILRAITARSLVASGLLPTFGIHHHNKYNSYALADDIMEPYRPFADLIVLKIIENNINEIEETGTIKLTTNIKKEILIIPTVDVVIDGQKSPLMIAMQHTTSSLNECFEGLKQKILYPKFRFD